MIDRELLEAAAKAAGIGWSHFHMQKGLCLADVPGGMCITQYWNPLQGDDDALRLAVKLGIEVRDAHQYNAACAYIPGPMTEFWEANNGDPYAATRRAIVRAAAAMAPA